MSSPREQFDALLRAATARREGFTPEPAFGLETRVLAAWRSSRGAPMLETGVLVRGLMIAGLLMVLSVVPALDRLNGSSDSDVLRLADSSVLSDYAP